MKPNPLLALNHLTLPVSLVPLFIGLPFFRGGTFSVFSVLIPSAEHTQKLVRQPPTKAVTKIARTAGKIVYRSMKNAIVDRIIATIVEAINILIFMISSIGNKVVFLLVYFFACQARIDKVC
jgi:hypothetical protein